MALTPPTTGLRKKLNPLGEVMDIAGQEAKKASQSFKGLERKPYDYMTAPSPFTKENAPTTTGALTGAGTGSEMKAPIPVVQAPQQTQVSSMAGRKNVPTEKPDTSIIPVANAGEIDTIQKFLDDTTIEPDKKRAMLSALNENPGEEDAIRQHLQQKYYPQDTSVAPTPEAPQEQGFIGGAIDKTKGAFMGGIERIGEAGEGLATGKYNTAEAFVRGGAGALQSAFSPISGLIGQTVQSGVEKLPQDFKDYVASKANPTVEDAKAWYNSQSPEQKRNLDNIGVGVELLANFVGAGAVQKSAPIIKQGVVKGVQKTGDVLAKTGETIAKTPGMIKKGVGVIDDGIEAGVEKLAGKTLGSSDGSKELFKATSPSYNTLAKSKDIKGIVNKSKLADEAVVEYGYKPTNTTERVTAYKDTMKNVWDDVEKTRGNVATKFNAKELADTIDSEVSKLSVGGVINPAIKSDVDALMKQADYFRKIGNIDIPTLGNQRTLINAMTDWGSTTQFGNTFSNIMKKVAGKIKESEDVIIGGLEGGKVSDKLRKYGALRSMYDDVVKQDIKALRAKGMGIEESFGRIAGISETLGGIAQIALNPKQALPTILSGGSKILLGKVAGKLKDPNYLIKTGYEKLSKSLSPKTIKNGTIRGNPTTPSPNLNRASPIGGIPKKQRQINLAEEKIKAGLTPKPAPIKGVTEKVNPLDLSKNKKGFIKNPLAKSDDLVSEAKKYKSAEEFVKAKEAKGEVFYHGTNKDFHFSDFNETKSGSLGETGRTGYFLTNDPSEAMIYAKEAVFQTKNGTPTIKKLLLNTDKIKRLPEGQSTAKTERLELARKEGYHAVMDDRGNIAVFDKRFIVEPKDLFKNKKGSLNIGEIGKSVGLKPKGVIPEELKGLDKNMSKYLLTRKTYSNKSGEYSNNLNKIAEKYPDGKGGISNDGRNTYEFKENKKMFDYYSNLEKSFNSLDSSKKLSKEFQKLGIAERQKINRSLDSLQ